MTAQAGIDHTEILRRAYVDLRRLFETSHQAMYLYYDDMHKICNDRFARLLGYDSPEEWSRVELPFTDEFVEAGASTEALVNAYRAAQQHFIASCVDVNWLTKQGETVPTRTILVPYVRGEDVYALHFIQGR